jgi:hypothetical protein
MRLPSSSVSPSPAASSIRERSMRIASDATVIFTFDPHHPPRLPLHSLPTKRLSLSPAAGAPQVFAGLQTQRVGRVLALPILGGLHQSVRPGLNIRQGQRNPCISANERPPTANRAVFVPHRASYSYDTPINAGVVQRAVRDAYRRCGWTHSRVHLLRHTIADVLRHRSFDTSAIYAKVDLNRLAAVALPWPGSASGQRPGRCCHSPKIILPNGGGLALNL